MNNEKIENITSGDIKKMLPYKKINHLSEYLEKTKKIYDKNVYEILYKRLFNESNIERQKYFSELITKIKYIGDENFLIFEKIVIKILKRTNLYSVEKDIIELIERFANKKLTLYKLHFEQMKNMFDQCQPKTTREMSKDGKCIYTYFTVKDLEGNVVSSYYMSNFGRKGGGLSDQYYIHKIKQLAEKNPEFIGWKEIAECYEKLYSLESLNKKNEQYNNLAEYEKEFDICKKIAKDVGWI